MSQNNVHAGITKKQQGNEAMSTAIASEYVRKMVERETAGNGDMENAVRRLARKHGLSFWQLMHLKAGRAKAISIDAFTTIRMAYLNHCEEQINQLRREVEAARGQHDDFEDLDHQIEALASRIRQAKGR